ncbi:hypothetical protein HN803_00265 [candidate division WWE3 bacterium]|jgi:acyl carrier protein|nr:hypothetical protein [candidate division WWE3 bacterium]
MDYIVKVKEIISKHAGIEIEEIKAESFFEEDLNIGELELNEIYQEIEETLEVDLSEERKEFETFEDLVGALNEKLD